eukprot:CAMPEP_0178952854 /NCGR_PEP_ID=MMETSP0789-20121207/8086_1 /TAXON_ID=3005 /ORGANISM="Rhizosolenia setigera, Strain CCMP 1694" /LENGTH=274 /DNA_ID=CAMNT_0020634031 /DNA_START=46 /DNA_END=867 /DNA_ORIENTATION=-
MELSYVSRQWPDVPAIFESLNDDTLTTVLEFVGGKSYRSFGGVNEHCKEIYIASGMKKETFLYGYGPLSAIQDKIEEGGRFHQNLYEAVGKGVVFYNRSDVLAWALQERNNYVLREICNLASREGRIDMLEEVWDNIEDDDEEYIFRCVGSYAGRHGNLDVLEWLETKGLFFNIDWCAEEAASHGHLHIIEWLIEEQGLRLFGGLYNSAIHGGGHLNVMTWLREQKVPWDTHTFVKAAEKGNLDILQWLHDEGCSWDRSVLVIEHRLYSGAIDW